MESATNGDAIGILEQLSYQNLLCPIGRLYMILMAKSDLKLVGRWSSPFVMRVKIALNIKSLDYENFHETLNPKSDLLLQSNPVYKKIPVLIHGDKPICESLIIVEYIDEVWSSAPSILPSDPYDRSIARFWAAYIDDKWFPTLKSIFLADEEESKKQYIKQLEEVVVRMEDAFLNISKGKDFFGGNRIGYLDIAFGCFLGWMRMIEKLIGLKLIGEAKCPALAKWAERFAADAAVEGLIPESDKLIELYNPLKLKSKALAK
ncbi:Glutathione S-transferase family protein [Quillaja saponaria]|uniref:glutathione transferase n=1 Tax=Quillaja saponaria TaxID=32244 RepID=A0AAD7PFJ5_QUISA|nr:Glutathione S-transferase family protein [Quillaja saponaria]